MAKWAAVNIPDQAGRTVVITGAKSGIGAVTAAELARAGARVISACRNTAKGEAAASSLAGMAGTVQVRSLDLADLDSVRAFASALSDPVDILINNAGVMA